MTILLLDAILIVGSVDTATTAKVAEISIIGGERESDNQQHCDIKPYQFKPIQKI